MPLRVASGELTFSLGALCSWPGEGRRRSKPSPGISQAQYRCNQAPLESAAYAAADGEK